MVVSMAGAGFEAMYGKAAAWMRICFWRACKDMLVLDREDDLRCMWREASKERRDRALEHF